VTADEAYGQEYKFRIWCEQRRIGYVVVVPGSQSIPMPAAGALISMATGSRRADDLCRRSGAGVEAAELR
jgi:hypothetical protein